MGIALIVIYLHSSIVIKANLDQLELNLSQQSVINIPSIVDKQFTIEWSICNV